MDAAEFNRLALRTERPVDADVYQRFDELAPRVHRLLMLTAELSEEADGLKRALFYGKRDRLAAAGEGSILDASCQGRMAETLRVIHGLLGIVSEAGEMITAFSNYWDGEVQVVDVVNVLEEVGDSGWYNAIICDWAGSNMGEAYEAVIRKLEQRQKNKFTEQEAVERDLAAERRALENSINGEGRF